MALFQNYLKRKTKDSAAAKIQSVQSVESQAMMSQAMIESVEGEIKKKNESDWLNELIDYERDYHEKVKIELLKTVNILEYAQSEIKFAHFRS